MKANNIIIAAILVAGLTMRVQAADDNNFSPRAVATQRAADYVRQLDALVRPIREEQSVTYQPDADTLLELRTTEYQLQWFYNNGLLARPPLNILAAGVVKKKLEIPGRIILARLAAAGLDPLEPGLDNKVFRFAEFDGPRHRAATNSFVRPLCSTNFPADGDFLGHHAYAIHLVHRREWADAARHFVAATEVPFGGTTTLEWEFNNHVSAAWMYLLAGQFDKSRAALEAARRLPLNAEVPQRARFLMHLYRLADPPPLAAEWEACMPK